MNTPAYMQEAWFALLRERCLAAPSRVSVAQALGISAPMLSQVLNGSGLYGKGVAGTERMADKVLHTYGNYPCPYLSEEKGEVCVISADVCRGYAHRPVPTASPRDIRHWQACRKCKHLNASAPPVERVLVPRKKEAGDVR